MTAGRTLPAESLTETVVPPRLAGQGGSPAGSVAVARRTPTPAYADTKESGATPAEAPPVAGTLLNVDAGNGGPGTPKEKQAGTGKPGPPVGPADSIGDPSLGRSDHGSIGFLLGDQHIQKNLGIHSAGSNELRGAFIPDADRSHSIKTTQASISAAGDQSLSYKTQRSLAPLGL